jgi:SAM-dependent methyltransferase/tetratricopeptide (TPR) repeat protein
VTLTVAELLQEAMAHHGRGELVRAEQLYGEVIEQTPGHAGALLNFGILRAGQDRMEEAVALFERAVDADPRVPEAQFSLGRARLATGDSAGALAALVRARELGADSADVHYGIGSVHAGLGDMPMAVASFAQAVERERDHFGAQHGLLSCLNAMPANVDTDLLESAVGPLLRGSVVNPRSLGHATARLLARKHGSAQASCDALLEDDVARTYLKRTVNVSADVERLLTAERARWLVRAGGSEALESSTRGAVAAVAIQCFLNEYVWAVSEEEERLAAELEERVVAACRPAGVPGDELVSDLLVLACYRPLWRAGCAEDLAAVPAGAWPDAVRDLLRVCLHEPLKEQALRERIVSGAAIRDGVSKAVQAQYEEHPYPRWTAITRGGVQSLEDRVRRWRPDYAPSPALGGSPRVLVAGCGTGIDAIELAMHVRGAQVTAIDLSRASLAFAMRKSAEYGLENIRFCHEDILVFEGGDSPYHMINCTGVLHHMQDVAAGLARLVPLLTQGGLMKIALYSRIAREPLLRAREDIRAAGFGPATGDIRRFRRQVLDAGPGGAHGELLGSTDFYSTSECRDLLFHVQELQLTLPEIRVLLEDAGLAFLCFELTIPEVEEGFRREHPGTALDDLDAWHAYEQRHPESFRGMYYFWCRKVGP